MHKAVGLFLVSVSAKQGLLMFCAVGYAAAVGNVTYIERSGAVPELKCAW